MPGSQGFQLFEHRQWVQRPREELRIMWQQAYQPRSLAQTLALLQAHGARARMVAGGTDALVELSRGIKPTQTIIDLSHVDELRYVRDDGRVIAIGGTATHNDVLASRACRARALPLVQACAEVGAPQIRTRATIAGNLVTASPANDTIVPLLAMGAQLCLSSAAGEREIDIAHFFTGFRSTALRAEEIVREIRVTPLASSERGIFLKLGLRRAQAISVISLAVVADLRDGRVRDARIALGCVAPVVVRAPHAEEALRGNALSSAAIAAAARAVLEDIAPIADVRGSAGYRAQAVTALLTRALERIASDACANGLPDEHVLLDSGHESPVEVEPFRETIVTEINGTRRELRSSARKTLLNALRDEAGLTGAKEGCAEGECGACTVWLDGKAVMSCLVPAVQAHGLRVVTIEGLARGDRLHPLQQAYVDNAAVQCGFCIPGMLMAGAKLLQEVDAPDLDDMQTAISGNLCRCTGYRKILDAMQQAAPREEAREAAPV